MEEINKASLWRYTTLKIGGIAQHLYHPANADELVCLLERLTKNNEPWYILGGGSNLLVSSQGFAGTVIRMTQMTRITSCEPTLIEADAGVRLPHLAKYAASLGLSGLEFAVGIPGTVGGAVVMNAGAHGSCVANILHSVTVFDTMLGKLMVLTNKELEFRYRHSNINPQTQVVVSACFRFFLDKKENIESRIRHNEEYRWKTQPLGFPNAGSTFVNPGDDRSAGYLLDKAGAKQLKEGPAAVSAIHANFVVNTGGATSAEVITLMRRMQECVYNTFQVRLAPEWKTLGIFSSKEQEVWNNWKQ